MARTQAAQIGIGGDTDAAVYFNFETTSNADARRAAAMTGDTALPNANFYSSTYSLQGDLRRIGVEQRFNNASVQTTAARGAAAATNNFVERYPAAQSLKFSETKAAEQLAYTARTGEIYRFADGKQWRVVDVRDDGGTGLGGAIFSTGFRAVVLRPVDENDCRVVVSFAGSGGQVGDWVNNFSQAGGNTPAQYRMAASLAREYRQRYGDNVVLTGHSLGGGLASYASLQTGLRATAINSAALSPNNLGGNALFHPSVKNNARITQYYVPGEVLTNLDNIDLFDARPGNKIAVPGRYNRWLDPRAAIGNHLLGNLATDVPAPVRVR
jgi:pimeloyl-ACP methyl ester carboxylesterase